MLLALVSGPTKVNEEIQFCPNRFLVLCLSLELFAYSLLFILYIYKKLSAHGLGCGWVSIHIVLILRVVAGM